MVVNELNGAILSSNDIQEMMPRTSCRTNQRLSLSSIEAKKAPDKKLSDPPLLRWQQLFFKLVFLKVPTTLVDLLIIERMLHLSHVKQMYSQPIHLSLELILCTQLTGGKVDFNDDSQRKVLAGTKFWACDLRTSDLLWNVAEPSFQDLAIFWLHKVG